MFSTALYQLTANDQGIAWDIRSFIPHGFLYWVVIGLLAGWLAGKISRGRGFGCLTDIVLGIVGSFIGGWVFVKLGIFGGGFWYSLAAATLGAVILVSIAHLFSGSHDH